MTARSPAGQSARDRLVPLAGAMNFRDLGGYLTAVGGLTRHVLEQARDTLLESSGLVTQPECSNR